MSARIRFVVVGLVVLGLALRGYHYFRCPSVWHDEAALVVNVLDADFGRLLGPLRFHEAAPPLFLWLERAVRLALGDGVYALRLPPFLASCAALLLMTWVARRLLAPQAVPWAVLLFACSEQLLWHACEAKPYAFDVLAAVLVLAVHAGLRHGPLVRQLLAYAALAPVLIFLSYPACFLYGGVLAALLPAVGRARRATGWLAYLLLAAAVAGPFLALVLGPVRAQHDAEMASCWTNFFPDWGRPWRVPVWAAGAGLDVFRYCVKPLGQTLAPFAALGAVAWWRSGGRARVALLAVPVGLAFVASLLNRYPFGGARVMVYAAPAVALLAAAGAARALDWLRERGRLLAFGALAVGLLVPLWSSAETVARPWARPDVSGAAEYVAARRRPADAVAGNDWTHAYYFRKLGPAFHPLDAGPAADAADERCWLVYTEQADGDARTAHALGFAPAGWRAVERRDFAFTTVLLLARP
jgi:hypothetical protein